jgi:hypothetical protein
MSVPSRPEVWLRGTLPGINPVLMPEARVLLLRYDARSVHYEVREMGTEGRT